MEANDKKPYGSGDYIETIFEKLSIYFILFHLFFIYSWQIQN